MARRHASHASNGITLLLVIVLCALIALAGCAQQPQATTSEQPSVQNQTDSTQTDSAQEDSAVDEGEQKQADALAKEYLDVAAEYEPAVTQDLQAYEDDQTKLVALDHRFKSQESLARKILLNAHTEEISLEEAAEDISDVLRYTMCVEPDVYVSRATDVLKSLEDKGYTVVKFKNKWDGDTYKGLNTLLKYLDGIVFELQFHTPESYEVYNKTHEYYEIARAEDSTEEQVEEATRIRRELNEGLEIPEGALEFTWE